MNLTQVYTLKDLRLIKPITSFKPDRPKKVWISESKMGKEVSRIKQEEVIKQAMYSDVKVAGPFKCDLSFMHLLSRLTKTRPLNVRIPETLVFGYGFETPTFLYTDSNGKINYKSKLNFEHLEIIQQIFKFHKNQIKKNFPTPICIIKSNSSQFNRLIMKSYELQNEIKYGSDIFIQRYVLPKGNKACKLRVVWQENTENKYYSITNKKTFDNYDKKVHTKHFIKKNDFEVNSNKIEVKNIDIFKDYHEASTNPLNRNKSESEVLKLGQRYLNERNIAGKLRKLSVSELGMIELGNPELTSGVSYIDNRESNVVIPVISENRKSRSNTELNKYFQDSYSHKVNSESLESLYKKLHIPGNPIHTEHSPKEEILQTSSISMKLRGMFCTDTYNLDKILAFQIKSHSCYLNIDNMMNNLRKSINQTLLLKKNQHINQLVCDFIEDSNQIFYLIKIKFYSCISHPPPIENSIPNEIEFKCPGKYCTYHSTSLSSEIDEAQKLNNKPKVFKIFKKTLLENQETDILKIIKPMLHQTVDVCENCFYVYMKKEKEQITRFKKEQFRKDLKLEDCGFMKPIKIFKNRSPEAKPAPAQMLRVRKCKSKGDFFKKKKKEVLEACKYNCF
jgi:hypothetical protein